MLHSLTFALRLGKSSTVLSKHCLLSMSCHVQDKAAAWLCQVTWYVCMPQVNALRGAIHTADPQKCLNCKVSSLCVREQPVWKWSIVRSCLLDAGALSWVYAGHVMGVTWHPHAQASCSSFGMFWQANQWVLSFWLPSWWLCIMISVRSFFAFHMANLRCLDVHVIDHKYLVLHLTSYM